jgi:hypothetical protein
MSPINTLPGPHGIDIGELLGLVNNDCCCDAFKDAFPEWHEMLKKTRKATSDKASCPAVDP